MMKVAVRLWYEWPFQFQHLLRKQVNFLSRLRQRNHQGGTSEQSD